MKGLQLIADKGCLFHLQQFKSYDKSVKETINLLERKINGDDPTREEWRGITNAITTAITNAYALTNANVLTSAYAYALTSANVLASAYAYALTNASASANAYDIATVDYIISLLGDDLVAYPNIDKLVLNAIKKEGNSLNMSSWHSCETTHCRAGWEVVITEQGRELEKYFGTCMAATIIHKKSTGKTVDYYATKDEVMLDLRST